MPPSRLNVNDTPKVVALCVWHLRRVFNDERLWERTKNGELDIRWGPITLRKHPTADVPSALYNQEFILFSVATMEEVARCHWFLESDKETPAASKKPDPKEINWQGSNYHQVGRKNPECEHCKAGISTYSDDQNVPK